MVSFRSLWLEFARLPQITCRCRAVSQTGQLGSPHVRIMVETLPLPVVEVAQAVVPSWTSNPRSHLDIPLL